MSLGLTELTFERVQQWVETDLDRIRVYIQLHTEPQINVAIDLWEENTQIYMPLTSLLADPYGGVYYTQFFPSIETWTNRLIKFRGIDDNGFQAETELTLNPQAPPPPPDGGGGGGTSNSIPVRIFGRQSIIIQKLGLLRNFVVPTKIHRKLHPLI